jgi:hypothetical protein
MNAFQRLARFGGTVKERAAVPIRQTGVAQLGAAVAAWGALRQVRIALRQADTRVRPVDYSASPTRT